MEDIKVANIDKALQYDKILFSDKHKGASVRGDKAMPATLEIEKETARMLTDQAKARGISVDAYLRFLLEGKVASEEKTSLSPQERAILWREWVDNHSIKAPPLPDYVLTRESIYAEREDKQL